jgi:hypothetical protein
MIALQPQVSVAIAVSARSLVVSFNEEALVLKFSAHNCMVLEQETFP